MKIVTSETTSSLYPDQLGALRTFEGRINKCSFQFDPHDWDRFKTWQLEGWSERQKELMSNLRLHTQDYVQQLGSMVENKIN